MYGVIDNLQHGEQYTTQLLYSFSISTIVQYATYGYDCAQQSLSDRSVYSVYNVVYITCPMSTHNKHKCTTSQLQKVYKQVNKLCTRLGKFSSLPNHVNSFVHLFTHLTQLTSCIDACARLVCPLHAIFVKKHINPTVSLYI